MLPHGTEVDYKLQILLRGLFMKSRWGEEMLLLQRRIGFQRLAYWYGGGIWAFLLVPCYMKFIIAFLLTVFFPPESFCVGPQVPSVAVYSTKDKQSKCRLGSVILLHPTSSCSIIALYFLQTFHWSIDLSLRDCNKRNPLLAWLQRCLTWRQTKGWTTHTTICRCPKWRTRPSS